MTDPVTVQPTRDQLRALADKATPGPWTPCTEGWSTISSGSDSVFHAYHPRDCCHECGEPYDMEPGVAIGVEDLEFIAAARTAVPQLLDQLDRAEAEVKRLSWKCGHLADKYATDTEELRQEAAQAEARIKAVRDIHTGTHWPGVTDKPICDACDEPWPCDTSRALD